MLSSASSSCESCASVSKKAVRGLRRQRTCHAHDCGGVVKGLDVRETGSGGDAIASPKARLWQEDRRQAPGGCRRRREHGHLRDYPFRTCQDPGRKGSRACRWRQWPCTCKRGRQGRRRVDESDGPGLRIGGARLSILLPPPSTRILLCSPPPPLQATSPFNRPRTRPLSDPARSQSDDARARPHG